MDGLSYHRVFLPNQYIDHEVRFESSLNDECLSWCDVLMYHRLTMMSPDFLRAKAREHGFKIWVDNDDALNLHKDHPNYETFTRTKAGLTVRAHLMNADAVITTHQELADHMSTLNDNIAVIPNALPYGEGQFKPVRTESDRLRLVYAASAMNYRNVDLLSGVMKKLENVELVILGYSEGPFHEHIIKVLTNGGSIPYTTVPWEKELEHYMDGYIGDVMILPNRDSEFNRMKSNLKILEAGARGMPIVLNENPPYAGVNTSGVRYANKTSDWVDIINEYSRDKSLAVKHGDELCQYCKENHDVRNTGRSDIYNRL